MGDYWSAQAGIRAAGGQVREIIQMPEVTAMPLRRPQDRGVINLRGHVLPLVDLRKLFGWKSVPEEIDDFQKLMNQREQDHRNWLGALENSVNEATEFRLARDPHKCAFGQWYYSYRAESPWVTALLREFENPHNMIHALASEVLALASSGHTEEARKLIVQRRDRELRKMISLFEELKQLVQKTAKEVAVIVTSPQNAFALAADSAIGVEEIPANLIRELHVEVFAQGQGMVRRVAERKTANSLVMILDAEMFDVRADRPSL